MHEHQRSPLLAIVLVGGVVLAVVGFVVVPSLLTADRGEPEYRGSSLKTLMSAEADFRVNDRDWNHVNDFWTGDVKSLWTLTNSAVRGGAGNTIDSSIKLIELSVASADADGTFIPAGGENVPLASYALPSAKAGYWFAAMRADPSAGAEYRQDTGGDPPMGRCHNLQRFAFVTFPHSPVSGRYVWIVNESNTMYSIKERRRLTPGGSVPPGLGVLPAEYLNWPSGSTLKDSWTKLD